MSKNHILLIHGTWCNGNNWGAFATELGRRGFTVHTPTLRHHGAPDKYLWENAQKVAGVGLLDYVDDLAALVDTMDSPPIIVGHSVGALLAQLLAARRPNKGVVLLAPAPAAGMFSMYPSMTLLWGRFLPQWLMRKPMYPCSWDAWVSQICNTQSRETQELYYGTLCAESGTAYFQMALWYLDPKRAARVDFKAIASPVLVVAGSEDRCTVPRIGRITAKRYGKQSTYVELQGSDHMITFGSFLPEALKSIDNWLGKNNIAPKDYQGESVCGMLVGGRS
ncbi:alpha/beta hydrolase [Pseudomonas aeruginosa]|uniref:alpha/beta hydrolase n=1 Tax=Pseudomonas aeruginosa TaxID=287 RepID=UPI000B4C7E79|nr:alpha/beta hydrolase [Pseudomonas aeruginosa]ASD18406.1 alpha/beta hydrolase [Pseudomonas aeruginosa]AVZ19210.1 alpha/beta hydrolase [Pseudomonas aeruginosa]MBG4510796.1 alpha/beta hydrolase [Pseudomonas aeruginosa]MBX5738689.1 alpha/beta hydrolase [Pseudomonas aeruginosa]MBX6056381.1 alpha/beta hydrolase [Pseudomonas aeruginosa]